MKNFDNNSVKKVSSILDKASIVMLSLALLLIGVSFVHYVV